jgi:beta-1,4-mannooligosaccharide/beta-1,4-mannosyl-N-acetylglucosamine phosphorylase
MPNETVVRRYKKNPIITPDAVPGANTIFNSAVVRFGDGYAGVFRIDCHEMRSNLHAGFSDDGIRWRIEPRRIDMSCAEPDIATHGRGYDPRVTQLDGKYYVTWCNKYFGATIGLAVTTDFNTFEQLENITAPYNRNGVLFPRKINGCYAMLHRPSDKGNTPFGDIFYCTSPDLIHWGRQRYVFGTAPGWQSLKVGAGPVPIEIDEGWLLIYHGVRATCSGFIYCAGGAILDRDEPWRVKYRSRNYLLAPTEPYERVGDVPNVVFPNGAVLDGKTGRLSIYYGAADTYVALAYAQLDELVDYIKKTSFAPEELEGLREGLKRRQR